MERTAVMLTFEKETPEVRQQIFDALFEALAHLDITPEVQAKDYNPEYGGPVIYIP